MWWIWPVYIILLVVVTFLSVLLARFVDVLDKKTKMSNGILGGVLLAGVSSLPELITSFSAVLLMNQPDMTFGNIMGSNFFDITIIGALMICMFAFIKNRKVGKTNGYFIWFSFFLSAVILVCSFFNWNISIPVLNINLISIIILVFYILVLFLSNKKQSPTEDEEVQTKTSKISEMSAKKIGIWFAVVSALLVAVSIGITYATEFISETYGIGKGIAGALLLGVATSLPEVVSSVELVRLGNFDMAVGNIFGSCMFNYLILSLVDIFYFAGSVFTLGLQAIYFACCMLASTLVFTIVYYAKRRNAKIATKPWFYVAIGMVMVTLYIACIIFSAGV